jgi:hypothetical protein
MQPKDKTSEIYRLWDLSAGFNWVADSQRMLFACLSNTNAKEAHLLEFNGTIPATYAETAKFLYKVVESSEDLKEMAAQRICGAIEDFLSTVLSTQEMAEFKRQNPRNEPRRFANILEEIREEGSR